MDAVKLTFEFDVKESEISAPGLSVPDLPAPVLARILLDVQYVVMASLALSGELTADESPLTDDFSQKYKRLIEATGKGLGKSGLAISRIKMESPLRLELLAKVRAAAKTSFAQAFHFIKRQVLLDLERERRAVEIELLKEDVSGKRIQNAAATLGLLQMIPEQHREQFFENLSRTALASLKHPPLRETELYEWDETIRDWRPLQPPPLSIPDRQEPTEDTSGSPPPPIAQVESTSTEEPPVRRWSIHRVIIIVLLSLGAVAALLFLIAMLLNYIAARLR